MTRLGSRLIFFCAGILLACCAFFGCRSLGTEQGEPVALHFSLSLDPDIYKQSHYKKPPQFAIWLEDAMGAEIRTVWVTEKTGAGSWGGKIVRPVSLPYWVSRWKKETGSSGAPTPENPAVDAVTGATPAQDLACETQVSAGSRWDYYIEINVSGDYNYSFAAVSKDGKRDKNGNGQPSIIYKGQITALPGRRSVPRLIGRTDQFESVDRIIEDLEGISTAKEVFSKIEVTGKSCNGGAVAGDK
ncbi:MAG: hypothetical protein CEE38_19875 [Planctomycetes bacterium B3_Pla]|nr:MAG: hypothetical protein CEE38_19875 [Planctomycetes bacterium B3_Pla]